MLSRIQGQLQQWKSSLLTAHAAEVVSAGFLSLKHSTLRCEQLFCFKAGKHHQAVGLPLRSWRFSGVMMWQESCAVC